MAQHLKKSKAIDESDPDLSSEPCQSFQIRQEMLLLLIDTFKRLRRKDDSEKAFELP